MSLLEQQVIELRRQLQLVKNSQVSITDQEPREPSKQSIWREGSTLKTWDGKNWINTSGGMMLDFTTSVVFSSSAYNSVSWSIGKVFIGTDKGVMEHDIGLGSFTMTANTFFYWAPDSPNSIQTTTVPEDAITSGGVLLAVGQVNSDPGAPKASIKTFGNNQNDLITADQIVANSITSNKLAAALVYAGSLTLATNGIIKGGQTAFNTGTGFFLGYSSGAYKLSIGDSSANYFAYDGTNMVVNGGIIRTGTSGRRIEISGNNFKSYDSLGVIRVQTADDGMRFTDYTGTYISDISVRNFSGPGGIEWAYMLVSDTSTPGNRVGVRTAFLAGHPTATDKSLSIYLDGASGGFITFKSIGGGGTSGTGVRLTSPDDDTLAFDGKKISFNGVILEKIGSDLYWNGVQIN